MKGLNNKILIYNFSFNWLTNLYINGKIIEIKFHEK